MNRTTIILLLCIVLLVPIWSCSIKDTISEVIEPIAEETKSENVSDDQGSSGEDSDEDESSGEEGDGAQTEIEGFTLTEEAIEITEFELVLDTISGTNEMVIDISDLNYKSSKSPPGPVKIGAILMDRAQGFLVEVVEIKDGVVTVVDASMDKFYKAGSIGLSKWYDSLEDREFEYEPVDLSFDFENDFVPHPNIHMAFGGRIQYRPSITGTLNFSDKIFNLQLGNSNLQDTLSINGYFKVGISGSFNLEENIPLGSVKKKVFFGHIPAILKLSLFYRPNLYGAIEISEEFSLDYKGNAQAAIYYKAESGFNSNASYVSHFDPYGGFDSGFKFYDNYGMRHGIYAKFQVLFFNVVGGEADFGFRYDVDHGSTNGDWHNRRSLNAEVNANIKEKVFNRVEDYARVDFDTKVSALTIPRRLVPINEIGSNITETFQFFVTSDYVDPQRITYSDYLRGVPNVQIHCFGGSYFGNGNSDALITTDVNGFAQITATQIGSIRNEGSPDEYISYDEFRRIRFEIRDGTGEKIGNGLDQNDF